MFTPPYYPFMVCLFLLFICNFSSSEALQNKELLTRVNATLKPQLPNNQISPDRQSIAIIDTGFDKRAPLLQQALDLKQAFNARDNNKKIEESILRDEHVHECHGTHIAGIVAQLSPYTKIVPIKVGGNRSPFKAFMNAYAELITKPVSIVNFSWGADLEDHDSPISQKEANAIKQLINSGKLLVMSAGNENVVFGTTEYTKSLIKLAKDPDIQGRLIFVGSSYQDDDLDERIVKSSNKAGKAANYFITAPGKKILSCVPISVHPSGYEKLSGSSMAAPVITGALSRLLIEYPQLSIDQVKDMLFQSADKTYRSDSKKLLNEKRYGQGVVNFNNASLACQQLVVKKKIKQEMDFLKLKLSLNKIDITQKKVKLEILKKSLLTFKTEEANTKSTIHHLQQQLGDLPKKPISQLQYIRLKKQSVPHKERLDQTPPPSSDVQANDWEFVDYRKRLIDKHARLKKQIFSLEEKIQKKVEKIEKLEEAITTGQSQIKKLKKKLL
jgi:hypothetical protein